MNYMYAVTDRLYTRTSNSCLLVFTVYGIFRPRKYIQLSRGTIPWTAKTMRQLTCTDRPYRANHQISFGAITIVRTVRRLYGVKYRMLGAVAILV